RDDPTFADFFETRIDRRHGVMRSVLVPDIGHPPGGEPDRKNSAVHETEVAAACLSDDSRRADFLELIENQEWVARIFGERFNQGMHRLQRFFAGKNRTFFKTVDVVPGKLPRLVEQQWKLFTICDSTKGRLFVCDHIIENRLTGPRYNSTRARGTRLSRLFLRSEHFCAAKYAILGNASQIAFVRLTYDAQCCHGSESQDRTSGAAASFQ